jgi:predicted transcriptional regulator
MAETGKLLLLLSSADRRGLLGAIDTERLRASQLASKLSLTAQETARQLGRLEEAGLIERDPRARFGLTGLGRLALRLLPAFDFLARHDEYLRSHDLSGIPAEFLERIGELDKGGLGDTLGVVLEHLEEVVDGAQDHVWLMADQVLLQDLVTERVLASDGLSLRIVIPEGIAQREGIGHIPSEFHGKIELGFAREVHVGMALNEKVAGVVFPDSSGKLDFRQGMRGSDPEFHRWCSDLFLWHWNQARKLS